MSDDFKAFLQEVYDLDQDRSTEYLFQHLTDTVKEWYTLNNASITEDKALETVWEFLEGLEDVEEVIKEDGLH